MNGTGAAAEAQQSRSPVEGLRTALAVGAEEVERLVADRAGGPCVRRYGRLDPRRVSATLVYEREGPWLPRQQMIAVEARLARDGTRGRSRELELRPRHFAEDPALGTAAGLLGELAVRARVRVVRYRPGRRLTIRVDPEGPGSPRFAKVLPGGVTDREMGAHLEHARALAEAARSGVLGFRVADPVRLDVGARTLWQGVVPGRPALPQLAGPSGAELAQRLGRALATLPGSGLRFRSTLDRSAQLHRTRRYAARLGALVPRLGGEARELVATLEALHARIPDAPLRPIHGSPHPSQWLVDGAALGLVDFDRASMGDPELDVATFLGELDFEDARLFPRRALERAFVAGYEELAGRLRVPLLAAYRAEKRLAKALRTAAGLKPGAPDRAARHLALARRALLEGSR